MADGGSRVDKVIRLARSIVALEDARSKANAEFDIKIEEVRREIAALTGEQSAASPAASSAPRFLQLEPFPERRPSYNDMALDAIRKNHDITYGELAKLVYGENTHNTRVRVRSVVWHLINKSKKLRARPEGGWEPLELNG